jgi:hypothetical protein
MNCPTTGKKQYNSEKEAQKALHRFTERNPEYQGKPYLCMYCHSFHFGQRNKTEKKRRKRT